MERQEVENIIKTYGTGSPEFKGRKLERNPNYSPDGILYEPDTTSDNDLDVFINGEDLYVANIQFVKFEVDNWGLVVRLYYDCQYIGCITESWEDIKTFKLGRT